MNEKQAKEKTEELINADIELISFEHVRAVKEYRLAAKTLGEEEINFRVNFRSSDGGLINCNLPQQIWDRHIFNALSEILDDSFDKYKLDITFYSSEEEKVDLKNIPDITQILSNLEASNKLEVRVYLFQDLEKETYEDLIKFVEESRLINLESINFNFTFYDQEYFEDKSLEDYTFGFKALKNDFFEMQEKEQLRKRIVFELPATSELPSIEKLVEITDQNPNVFGSKPNRL